MLTPASSSTSASNPARKLLRFTSKTPSDSCGIRFPLCPLFKRHDPLFHLPQTLVSNTPPGRRIRSPESTTFAAVFFSFPTRWAEPPVREPLHPLPRADAHLPDPSLSSSLQPNERKERTGARRRPSRLRPRLPAAPRRAARSRRHHRLQHTAPHLSAVSSRPGRHRIDRSVHTRAERRRLPCLRRPSAPPGEVSFSSAARSSFSGQD